jgi:hypothetical protein
MRLLLVRPFILAALKEGESLEQRVESLLCDPLEGTATAGRWMPGSEDGKTGVLGREPGRTQETWYMWHPRVPPLPGAATDWELHIHVSLQAAGTLSLVRTVPARGGQPRGLRLHTYGLEARDLMEGKLKARPEEASKAGAWEGIQDALRRIAQANQADEDPRNVLKATADYSFILYGVASRDAFVPGSRFGRMRRVPDDLAVLLHPSYVETAYAPRERTGVVLDDPWKWGVLRFREARASGDEEIEKSLRNIEVTPQLQVYVSWSALLFLGPPGSIPPSTNQEGHYYWRRERELQRDWFMAHRFRNHLESALRHRGKDAQAGPPVDVAGLQALSIYMQSRIRRYPDFAYATDRELAIRRRLEESSYFVDLVEEIGHNAGFVSKMYEKEVDDRTQEADHIMQLVMAGVGIFTSATVVTVFITAPFEGRELLGMVLLLASAPILLSVGAWVWLLRRFRRFRLKHRDRLRA